MEICKPAKEPLKLLGNSPLKVKTDFLVELFEKLFKLIPKSKTRLKIQFNLLHKKAIRKGQTMYTGTRKQVNARGANSFGKSEDIFSQIKS